MADTYTTSNRLIKMALNSNVDTWDQGLNAALDMIDEALEGATSITMAAGTTVLTDNDNATDQSRMRHLLLTGTSGTITLPAGVPKWYFVRNNGSGAATIGHATGTTVVVDQRAVAVVRADGTDCTLIGQLDRGWQYVGAGSFTGTSVAVTLPLNSYTEWRLKLVDVTHAAGANRNLQVTVAVSTGDAITNHVIGAIATATATDGSVHLMSGHNTHQSSGYFLDLTTRFEGSTSMIGTFTDGKASGTMTFTLSSGSSFTNGTYVVDAR